LVYRIGLAKSKLCKPVLNVVSVHGILLFIKLDHITSHVLYLNSPGGTSGFIVLRILSLCARLISTLAYQCIPVSIVWNQFNKVYIGCLYNNCISLSTRLIGSRVNNHANNRKHVYNNDSR
jgi:hypothetical protein